MQNTAMLNTIQLALVEVDNPDEFLSNTKAKIEPSHESDMCRNIGNQGCLLLNFSVSNNPASRR